MARSMCAGIEHLRSAKRVGGACPACDRGPADVVSEFSCRAIRARALSFKLDGTCLQEVDCGSALPLSFAF